MIIIDEERASDSPFVERVWRSHSEGAKPFLSIAVNHSELVEAALQGEIKGLTQRAVQYRFLQATGITQNAARQIERARYAPLLLQQGVSILDTVEQVGYYDQPHLTRSLTRFIGQTPAQLFHHSRPEQLSFLYKTTPLL
jgi:methylphosphotriester-DNA--protein-cysteine methyltransferase